jgi:2-polyprenyl-3-methyl-5-hydroxy-6-metoxy-1,4-benzoquinol methylase
MAEKTTNHNLSEEKFKLDQLLTQQLLKISNDEIKYITSRLPDKRFYEFAYHMLFQNKFTDLEKEWQKWKPWNIWDYPIFDLNRFNIIACQNDRYIRDKKILDIGCNIGYLSLFCLCLGCENVLGIDAREEKLNIADFICNKAKFSNHTFRKVDINHKDSVTPILNGIETIVFSGVLYHVSNHYEILRRLSDSTAETMIIENEESHEFRYESNPHIFWHQENTKSTMNGYSNYHDRILVGAPNQTWINTAMQELGWRLLKTEYFVMDIQQKKHHRCCSVFVR